MVELYGWQEDALDSLRDHDYNGVIKVASGKGKTILSLAVLEELFRDYPGTRALVVVPTIHLMYHWDKEIKRFLPDVSTSYYYGAKKDLSGQVVLSVINSAAVAGFKPDSFRIKILDEIHHYGAELHAGIFSVQTLHTIGLSATPEREDEGDLAIRFGAGGIVYSLDNLDELRERFSLCTVRIPLTGAEYGRYNDLRGEYRRMLAITGMNPGQVEYKARRGSKYALRVLKLWSQMAWIRHHATYKLPAVKRLVKAESDQKIIIFSESIEFAENVGRVLDAIVVHSKMAKSEVKRRLEEFRAKDRAVLVAPRMIDEGYDVPDATIAIIASFRRSARQMIQRDGRILRTKDYVRRYTLVIEGVEEEKFASLLQKTAMAEIAFQGTWLRFHDGFAEDKSFLEQCREYINHDSASDYEDWVRGKLDFYKRARTFDSTFYERHKTVIDRLVEEHPGRWPDLETDSSRPSSVDFHSDLPGDEQRVLKDELRSVNARIGLPDNVFRALMRAIEGETIELDDEVRQFVRDIASQTPPSKGNENSLWTDELHALIKRLDENIN
ncbi:MAG: DEAD/DEAH box helicase [Candidatus Woesearchaeota archaeon]